MVGRGRDVTDREILLAIANNDSPVISASDLAENLPIKQNQTNNRLNELHEQGLVDFTWIGRGKAWWLTDAGKEKIDSGSR